jgi:macrolide-specific efflux system membrane fusion protein
VKIRPRLRFPRRPRRLPLPRRPLEWGLAIVAAALIAIGVNSLGSGSSTSAAATKRTATVGKGVVQSTVSGNGTLEPAQKVELSFGASGEVTAIRAKAGQKVTKGEVLAEVDSSSARASLASAEAQRLEAEEAVEGAIEAEEEAEVEEREAEEEEEAEDAAGQGGEPAGAGESAAGAEPGAAGATVSLPTAEANLREARLAVKSARQEVRETTLRAPISGTVASVSGSVGETVTGGTSGGGGDSESGSPEATGGEPSGEGSGSAFMVVAQLHRLKMEVSFSESDIGKVRKGQTATVSIDSMEGTELAGRVTKVSVLPSESSSSVVEYPATILLSQSAKGLRAGMSASAEVVVEQVKDAVTVPSEAISAVGGKTVTVEEDGKEVTKSVTTGLEGDETTEVVSGLKAGQTVVLPEVSVPTAVGGGEGGEAGGFPGAGALKSLAGGGGGITISPGPGGGAVFRGAP